MDWMKWNWGDDIKKYVAELTDSMDTIILGRKLADCFILYWANVASDPSNLEITAGKLFTNTPEIVFSKTLKKSYPDSPANNWKNTILANDLISEVKKLKTEEGKDIIAYGGAEFVSNHN